MANKIDGKFKCLTCRYSTNNKSDFNKHMQTNKHIKLKYDKEKYIKEFKPEQLNGNKATLMALTFSHYIPPTHYNTKTPPPTKNKRLEETIKDMM